MRIESSVTSVSWLPLGAVQALPELAFASGVAHYDPPPPDQLHDPAELLARNRARFINQLHAFIEFEQTAGGHTGVATPHLVRRKPFVQLAAPTVWTTCH